MEEKRYHITLACLDSHIDKKKETVSFIMQTYFSHQLADTNVKTFCHLIWIFCFALLWTHNTLQMI